MGGYDVADFAAPERELQGAKDQEGSICSILSHAKAQHMVKFFGFWETQTFFGVLGDLNRWRILSALGLGEMRVGIAGAIDMTASAASHQLRVLRTMRLFSYQKRGRSVYYCLNDSHSLTFTRKLQST